MEQTEWKRRLQGILETFRQGHGLGVLCTRMPSGEPHACWMGTIALPRLDRVLTISSPDSRKVTNIRKYPAVEWMFLDEARETVLYLRGQARVVEEVAAIKSAWQELPDKSQAYFLPYQHGAGFVLIETRVETLEALVPKENAKRTFSVEDAAEQLGL